MNTDLVKRIACSGSLTATFVALPTAAHACAVCFGAADSTQTAGMNMAMLTLLGVTGTLFCGIGACILTFRRRVLAIEREAALGQHSEAADPSVDALREAEGATSDESLREDALAE